MKQENLGALWISYSKNPKMPFASGSLQITDKNLLNRLARGEKIPIVVWKDNRERNGKRYPDYTISYDSYRDEKKDGIGSSTDDIY